jgi:hypothetical protein
LKNPVILSAAKELPERSEGTPLSVVKELP